MSDFLVNNRWLIVLLMFCFGFVIPSSGAAFIYGIFWLLITLLIIGSEGEE
jgi:hypothetical protein